MKSPVHPGRGMLLALSAFCLLPVLAAWGVYRSAPQLAAHSFGQLLPTQRFAAADLPGWPLRSWSLVSVETGDCAAVCRRRVFALRQIRLAQGEAAAHLVLVRLRSTPWAHPPADEVWLSAPGLGARLAAPGYFLVDPLGNQVMFYPDQADPERVIGEVGRLMQINNGL